MRIGKKFSRLMSVLMILLMMLSLTACASEDIQNKDAALSILLQVNNSNMIANGIQKEIDEGRKTVPIVENGRTLVPIRAIIEECGGSVNWEQNTQTVTLKYKSDEIRLVIDSTTAYLNNDEKTLDVAPKVINERTMLPIRFVAENFKFNVSWDDVHSVITITNSANGNEVKIPSDWLIDNTNTVVIPMTEAKMNIHFIDVGQGDSIFIELPNNENLLIDAGPSAGIVSSYIKNLGYQKINYVIATHPDADHITGIPEVLNSFAVNTFYMPEKEHTTKIFESMLNAISNNGCTAEYAIAGKTIVDNSAFKVYFVGPTKIYSDNNTCSAVVKIEYNKNSFLFTGDAEQSSESDIIRSGYDVSADVLKIGHHGSSSSTSSVFLNAVHPKDAIISVGKNNKYGHPTAEILGLLKSHNINVYRTDEVGTIVITSDGINYTINKNKSVIESNAPPVVIEDQNNNTQQSETVSIPQQTQTQNNSAVVYRTKTGKKYHMAGCSYLKSSIQTTVAEAKSMGLTPCSKCNPPQ